jgi:transcriptional regulator with XRE-family HTH domain
MEERARLLIDARLKHGLTQEQAAARLEVAPATIRRWESGISTPQPINLYHICEVYGTTPQELGFQNLRSKEGPSVVAQNATLGEDEEEDATAPFRKRNLTARLTHLVLHWRLTRQRARYEELQRLITLELEEYSRMYPEQHINRRNALRLLVLFAIDFCILSSSQPANKYLIEEILTHCAGGITACWHLLQGKDLAFASQSISKYIPTLQEITKMGSASQQQAAADLLAQCFRLASHLANHLASKNNAALRYAKQAEYYSKAAQNPIMQIVALRAQANAYDFAYDWQSALHATQQAHSLLEELDRRDKQHHASSQPAKELFSPALASYIYRGLAYLQGHTGQKQEVLTLLGKAREAFFAQSSHEPPPIWATSFNNEGTLLLDDGRAHYYLGLYPEACTSFAKIETTQGATETARIEALITQVQAELRREGGPRDMDRCIALWEQALQRATAIQSQQWFNSSITTHAAMSAVWPGEKRIHDLQDQIKHW